MLYFTDGVKIDTSGRLRIKRLSDGYYVIGNGWSIPCVDHEDAMETLKDMKTNQTKKGDEKCQK